MIYTRYSEIIQVIQPNTRHLQLTQGQKVSYSSNCAEFCTLYSCTPTSTSSPKARQLKVHPSNLASEFLNKYKQDHTEQHSSELTRLASIVDPRHIFDSEVARNFRGNKYGVKMCKYSFELLMCFLQDNKFMLLLRLMNQYINIECISYLIQQAQINPDRATAMLERGLLGKERPRWMHSTRSLLILVPYRLILCSLQRLNGTSLRMYLYMT